MRQSGFTLIEIMLVAVVLGVIAALTFPNYMQFIEQSKANEAKVNLYAIYAAQKQYLIDHGSYWNGGAAALVSDVNSNLNIAIGPVYYNENGSGQAGRVSVVAGGNTFTAQLERTGAGTKTFSIDQTGAITESGSYP